MERKKKRKTWPWVLLAVAVILAVAAAIFLRNMRSAADMIAYASYTVERGSVATTITGSGKLEAAGTQDVELPDGIVVSEIFVAEGDSVKAGDILATLDKDSLADRAAALSGELSGLDAELARMSASKTTETVYASVGGRLKHLPVAEGDDVLQSISKFGSLAIVSADGLMQVEIPAAQDRALLSEVTVEWQDGSEEGTIAQRTDGGYLVTLSDEEAPYGATAKVYDGTTLLGEGTLEIHAPIAIYASGGTISEILCEVNDKLSATTKLFTLENAPLSSAYRQKYSERLDVAARLEAIVNHLIDPCVVALHDGVVSSVNVAEGAETGAGTAGAGNAASSGAAFEIKTGGAIIMMISVDELDIRSIALDQEAAVILDSIPSETFTANVTHISNLGNANGSITTYAVELTLLPDARFLEGMSGNATILVNRVDDVPIIPIEAIVEDSSGVFVYVGNEREKRYIETGLSDGEYAEVASGLSPGDVILYASTASEDSVFPGMPGGMGSFGNRGGGYGG